MIERIVCLVAWFLLTAGFVLGLVLAYSWGAFGQEMHHAPSEMDLHDKFYANWLRPTMRLPSGERNYSCCGKGDCYPTQFKTGKNGHTYFMRKTIGPDGERHETGEWVMVPDSLIEANQPDPRESPDGQSHVCESGMNVFCAVLGGQM